MFLEHKGLHMHGLQRAVIGEGIAAAPGEGREGWKPRPLPELHRESGEPGPRGPGHCLRGRSYIYNSLSTGGGREE